MINPFSGVLSAELLSEVRAVLQSVAPSSAGSQTLARALGPYLVSALRAHPEFDAALQPGALSSPQFVWHRANASSGLEPPDAFTSEQRQMRVDLRVVLWLSEPSAYEGGDVVVNEGGALTRWKRAAGDAIAYAAAARCNVEPVTRGELLVCTLDVQSLIAGEVERRVLFEFNHALQEFERRPECALHAETMRRLCNQLMRMWTGLPRRA